MPDAVHRPARVAADWRILRCRPLRSPARTGFSLRRLWRGLQQSFRLMVGVQDYQYYLQHMQHHHPDRPAMSEREFHRYCLEARFPGKAGKLGKCPC